MVPQIHIIDTTTQATKKEDPKTYFEAYIGSGLDRKTWLANGAASEAQTR